MKQVPLGGTTDTWRDRTKSSRSGDLAPRICVQIPLIIFVDIILGVSRSSCIVDIRRKVGWVVEFTGSLVFGTG